MKARRTAAWLNRRDAIAEVLARRENLRVLARHRDVAERILEVLRDADLGVRPMQSHRAYNKANKERIAAVKREWYKRNREEVAAYQRDYQERHRETIAAKRRVYYERNREKFLAYQRAYYKRRKRASA